METLDGYDLKEGEACFVSVQCGMGEHNLSSNPRKAFYLDEIAKEKEWDFTIHLRAECKSVEIIAVWKYKPSSLQNNIVESNRS